VLGTHLGPPSAVEASLADRHPLRHMVVTDYEHETRTTGMELQEAVGCLLEGEANTAPASQPLAAQWLEHVFQPRRPPRVPGRTCDLAPRLWRPACPPRLRLAMLRPGQDVLLDGPIERHEMGGESRDAHHEVAVFVRPLHGRQE
jgi:hypothetical protein